MHTLRVYRPLRSHGHAYTLARSALGVGIGSHLASMIVKQIWTDFEKVAPGSALRSGCPRLRGPRRVRRLRGLGLRSLLGSCPVFLCSCCSHLVLMIAKKIRTKLEKAASGSALERGLRAAGLLGLSGPSHVRVASPMGTEAVLRGASGDHGQKDERQRGVVDHKWVCCEEGDARLFPGLCQ